MSTRKRPSNEGDDHDGHVDLPLAIPVPAKKKARSADDTPSASEPVVIPATSGTNGLLDAATAEAALTPQHHPSTRARRLTPRATDEPLASAGSAILTEAPALKGPPPASLYDPSVLGPIRGRQRVGHLVKGKFKRGTLVRFIDPVYYVVNDDSTTTKLTDLEVRPYLLQGTHLPVLIVQEDCHAELRTYLCPVKSDQKGVDTIAIQPIQIRESQSLNLRYSPEQMPLHEEEATLF